MTSQAVAQALVGVLGQALQQGHSTALHIDATAAVLCGTGPDSDEAAALASRQFQPGPAIRLVSDRTQRVQAGAQARKWRTGSSWRMDETYIKVKGRWTYLYRAVDRGGQALDFKLSERRDLAAARCFFRRAISENGVPERIGIGRSGAIAAGLFSIQKNFATESYQLPKVASGSLKKICYGSK